MLLDIRHETLYRYSAPQAYSIQHLRLTPRSEEQQRVLSWHLSIPGASHAFTDAFGNLSHILTMTEPRERIQIVAHGQVETSAPPQGRLHDAAALSPLIFTVPTQLTTASPAVLEFAAKALPQGGPATSTRQLLALAEHIRGAVAYQSGATVVTSTADQALQLGQGVCQDHAHLFLACCHARAIPARYVSGYIDPESTGHAETHAWIDAWVSEDDYNGWVSIDVTHACLMSDAYCRLAIGRDYDSAAPVRGVRRGSGEEIMEVHATVRSVKT
jgi:transglutaminase-like putative cysteine protease